jgi:hypothetical protein
MLAPFARQAWHLYATLGALVGGGGHCLGYTGQSLFLPNWFVRRRGLAASLTFSGVGVGSIVLLPWLQSLIARAGWRAACWTLGLLVFRCPSPKPRPAGKWLICWSRRPITITTIIAAPQHQAWRLSRDSTGSAIQGTR